MKIIDLLNKIANEEESDLQTEFEFDGKIWNFYKINHSEYCLDGWLLNQNITITKHKEILDDEDEEKGLPEKLNSLNNVGNSKDLGEFEDKQQLNNHLLKNKLNEIIDYLDYIEKQRKGE